MRRLVIVALCQLQSEGFIMLWTTCFWGCRSHILSGLWWWKKFNKNVNTIRCCETVSLLQRGEIGPAPYLRDKACAHKHLHTLEHPLFSPVEIRRVKARSCSYNFFSQADLCRASAFPLPSYWLGLLATSLLCHQSINKLFSLFKIWGRCTLYD